MRPQSSWGSTRSSSVFIRVPKLCLDRNWQMPPTTGGTLWHTCTSIPWGGGRERAGSDFLLKDLVSAQH